MSDIELTKKTATTRQILKDIGYFHCIVCKEIKGMTEQTPGTNHCKHCNETMHQPMIKAVSKGDGHKPQIIVGYNMDTSQFNVDVLERELIGDEWEDVRINVYNGYIDDLWCHLGCILKAMGIDINAEE